MKRLIIPFLILLFAGCKEEKKTEKLYKIHLYDRGGIYKTYETHDYISGWVFTYFDDIATGKSFSISGNLLVERVK